MRLHAHVCVIDSTTPWVSLRAFACVVRCYVFTRVACTHVCMLCMHAMYVCRCMYTHLVLCMYVPAFSMTTLAWSILEYRGSYMKANQLDAALSTLKWGMCNRCMWHGVSMMSDAHDKLFRVRRYGLSTQMSSTADCQQTVSCSIISLRRASVCDMCFGCEAVLTHIHVCSQICTSR